MPAYIENIYEVLGTQEQGHPGEFYLDAPASLVYYVPHEEETQEATSGELPVLELLIDSDGASDLSFEGISFQHTTWYAFRQICREPIVRQAADTS